MNVVQALDVSKYSGEISQEQWGSAKSRGYDLAIVGAWHGTTANDHARNTLYNASQAGLIVAAYTVLNAEDGAKSVHDGFRACGDQADTLKFMALDVEVAGLTHKIFNAADNALISADVKACVYTRYSWWHDKMGNPEWGVVLPLWNADYEGGDTLRITKGYGGWTQTSLVGKQFQGSNSRLGFNADLNVFREDWWKG